MLAQQRYTTCEEDAEATDWVAVVRDRAACASEEGALVDLFFSEQLDDIARAKAICQTCPVMDPCLEGARERREPWGVWGGQLFMNGVILPYKRKRGRPPKHLSVAALGA